MTSLLEEEEEELVVAVRVCVCLAGSAVCGSATAECTDADVSSRSLPGSAPGHMTF